MSVRVLYYRIYFFAVLKLNVKNVSVYPLYEGGKWVTYLCVSVCVTDMF